MEPTARLLRLAAALASPASRPAPSAAADRAFREWRGERPADEAWVDLTVPIVLDAISVVLGATGERHLRETGERWD